MRPFRRERMASIVREIVSETIARRISDPRLEPLTTITRVDVSPDMLNAKILVTIPGDEAAERRTMLALQNATGFVQRQVAAELTVRQCPVLRFEVDRAMKIARRTMELIRENRAAHPEWSEAGASESTEGGFVSEDVGEALDDAQTSSADEAGDDEVSTPDETHDH